MRRNPGYRGKIRDTAAKVYAHLLLIARPRRQAHSRGSARVLFSGPSDPKDAAPPEASCARRQSGAARLLKRIGSLLLRVQRRRQNRFVVAPHRDSASKTRLIIRWSLVRIQASRSKKPLHLRTHDQARPPAEMGRSAYGHGGRDEVVFVPRATKCVANSRGR
jgi:hypothetical protein